MRNHSQNSHRAYYGVISAILLLCASEAVTGADLPASPPLSGVTQAEICFPDPDASRLLKAVEKDLPDCLAGADRADETIEAQENRIDELRGERDQCAADAKEAAKASEKAVDAARGSWWERLKSSATKVGAGVLIGIGIAFLL